MHCFQPPSTSPPSEKGQRMAETGVPISICTGTPYILSTTSSSSSRKHKFFVRFFVERGEVGGGGNPANPLHQLCRRQAVRLQEPACAARHGLWQCGNHRFASSSKITWPRTTSGRSWSRRRAQPPAGLCRGKASPCIGSPAPGPSVLSLLDPLE